MSAQAERFDHPNPTADRLTQIGGAALAVLMGIIIVAQIPAMIAGLPPLFAILIIVTCLGILPIALMWLSATPAVSVSDAGITLHPRVLRDTFVPWESVTGIKPYPLLPSSDTEITRRAMVGRRKYKIAEGVLLTIPSLGLPYRCHGWFAGEGFTGAIGLTNRTHQKYDRLAALLPLDARVSEPNVSGG